MKNGRAPVFEFNRIFRQKVIFLSNKNLMSKEWPYPCTVVLSRHDRFGHGAYRYQAKAFLAWDAMGPIGAAARRLRILTLPFSGRDDRGARKSGIFVISRFLPEKSQILVISHLLQKTEPVSCIPCPWSARDPA